MKLRFYSIFIFVVLFLYSCSTSNLHSKPPELIAFRTIESGKTDSVSISEILYRKNYNISLFENKNVNVKYDAINQLFIFNPKPNFSGLTFIKFTINEDITCIPLIVRKKVEVLFSYKPKVPPQKMYVMGNFNNWSRNSNEMLDDNGDGVYTTIVPLDDGVYEYQFVIDKTEIYDPENPEKIDNGFGYFNSLKRVKSSNKNNQPDLYYLPNQDGKNQELAIESNELTGVKIHVLIDNNLYSQDFVKVIGKRVQLNLNPLMALEGIHTLRIVATKNNQPGNVLTIWIKDGELASAVNSFIWNDAIIYSVMPDRFYNGNPDNDDPVKNPELTDQANFNGGDLTGLLSKMQEGYFDSLGVNTLWIFPLNKTTDKAFKEFPKPHRYYTGYHGYWSVAPREVEPRFGSIQDLKNIVNEAHNRDLKILLDFISNHTHIEHTYYKNHPEWYGTVDLPNGEKNIRRWDEYRLTTWFDTFLPSFDYLNNNDAIEAVTGDAIWWLENTNIDGFRHDATKHVPHRFWRALTKKIKQKINPLRNLNVYQVGETFGSDQLINSYVNNGMLDAQFNFNQFFVARRVFTDSDGNFLDLSSAIEKSLDVYGYSNVMGNLMDSHDQVRMMALLDSDLTLSENAVERAFQQPKIEVNDKDTYKKELTYFAYLLTIPGVPVIYYGDEFGMTGAGDPDNRRMMRFGNELNPDEKLQLQKVTKLIHLRKNYSAFRRGDYKTLYVSKDILAFMRGDFQNRFITIINKSGSKQNVDFKLPSWLKINQIQSQITTKKFGIKNNIFKIKMDSYSFDIFKVI